LFFPNPLSRVKKQITDNIKFKNPLNSVSLILWILLFILSLLYSHNTSPFSYTLLSLGIALFFVGWLIRYPPYVLERTLRKRRTCRGFLQSYFVIWNRLRLYINNPDLYGPWLEIIALAIIAKSIIVFIPAFFIFPIISGSAAIYKYKKLAAINPHTTFPSVRDLIPKVGNIFSIIIVPLAVAVLVGIITREFAIFYANAETAKSILFTLSQIEGGIGILAITIIFVLTQLTASNYSIRISTILFRQSAFWLPLIILFASITYNLIIASRSPIFFPSTTESFDSLVIDLSFVLGFATASSIAYFIFKAPRMVSPEAIITDALKNFDKEWLDKIKRDWCKPAFQLKLNVRYDPFIAVERVLSRAVDSGDNLTFISGLILIRDHLHGIKAMDPHKLPDYIIEIDAYLRHHFRYIVRTAARNSDAYTLLQLINFIKEVGSPSSESIMKCDTFAFDFDEAPGELTIREIIGQSAAYQLSECVTRGIHIVESGAIEVIKTLPKQTDTWLFNQMKPSSDISDEEQKRLWANDHRVENFERQYFSYLGSLGVKAADSKSVEIVRNSTWSLNNIISSVIQHVDGYTMKAMIVRQAIWSLDEIMKASYKNNLSDAMSLSMLQYAAEHTDPNQDESVAWYLVHYVSDFLILHAKLGLLHYMNVVDSAMFGLRIVEKYTNPAIHLLKSMGDSAKLLKNSTNYSDNKDLQLVYEEIINRIRQVGHGKAKDPKQIWATAKSVLESLNEPEFEERKK